MYTCVRARERDIYIYIYSHVEKQIPGLAQHRGLPPDLSTDPPVVGPVLNFGSEHEIPPAAAAKPDAYASHLGPRSDLSR